MRRRLFGAMAAAVGSPLIIAFFIYVAFVVPQSEPRWRNLVAAEILVAGSLADRGVAIT